MTKQLNRLPDKGQVAGVAAGFADYFSVDPTAVRIAFIIIIILSGGTALLIYIALVVIMPVGENVQASSGSMIELGNANKLRNWAGAGLVLLGFWYLIDVLFPGLLSVRWDIIWPLILIAIGGSLLAKGRI